MVSNQRILRCSLNCLPPPETLCKQQVGGATKKSAAKPRLQQQQVRNSSLAAVAAQAPNEESQAESSFVPRASSSNAYQPFRCENTRPIFRQQTVLSDELEEMWTLKRANPICDDHYASSSSDEDDLTASPQKRQRNADNSVTLHWNDRLPDDDAVSF